MYDTEGCVEGDGNDTPRQRAECVNACNTTWVRTFFENDTVEINPIFLMSHSLFLTVSCDVTLQCRAMGGVAVALDLAGTVDRCMNGNCRTSRHVKYYIANDEGFEYDNLFFSYIVHTQITNTDSINT